MVVCGEHVGPADCHGFFFLDSVPHALGFGAHQAVVEEVALGGEREGGMAFFLEFDAPDALLDHGLGHEFELVAVLDEFGQAGVVLARFDAQEVIGGFFEVFGFERFLEGVDAGFLDEVDFEVAFLDGAAEEGADFVDEVFKAAGEVVVFVFGDDEFFIAVGVCGGEFGEEFAKFEVEIEGADMGEDVGDGTEAGGETVEGAEAHGLFELDTAHGVDGEAAGGDLLGEGGAGGLDLIGEVAEFFTEGGGTVDGETGGNVSGFLPGGADILPGGVDDTEEGDDFEIGVIVIGEDEAGVETADHHGHGVFAGVFIGTLDFGGFVDAFDTPFSPPTGSGGGNVDGVGAAGIPEGNGEGDGEGIGGGFEGLFDVEGGDVGVVGEIDFDAGGHDHPEAIEADEHIFQRVGGEFHLNDAVREYKREFAFTAEAFEEVVLHGLKVMRLKEQPLVPVNGSGH